MKKLILVFIVSMFLVPLTFSQDMNEIFNSDKCTWYGLDFSKVQLIGSEDFNDPEAIRDRWFASWNYLFISESEKYDVGKAFQKDIVDDYLDIVNKRNSEVDVSNLVSTDNNYSISEDDVKAVVNEYDSEGKSGLGIVFVMEAFNKFTEHGSMWVTFFDIDSREVLLTQKLIGKAGGFGFRNYWAKTYYNVLKEVEKKKYKQWKKEYAK